MIEATININNPTGLHTRPAKQLVEEAKKYESAITIFYKDKEASAKSLLKLMKLGIGQNQSIILRCEGADEEKALSNLQSLILNLEG